MYHSERHVSQRLVTNCDLPVSDFIFEIILRRPYERALIELNDIDESVMKHSDILFACIVCYVPGYSSYPKKFHQLLTSSLSENIHFIGLFFRRGSLIKLTYRNSTVF